MRLDSVRVLDLTRLLPGPYGTQLLADMGADIVKIEEVREGDYGRNIGPATTDGTSTMFDSVNRGKRSIGLDLKAEEGREIFYSLVEEADVIFEQFRPGVVERLAIDYGTVRKYNEDIIYCSLSGYGQTGPYANRAGHDLNYIGVAGLLDMTREDVDSKPQMPGYQVGDIGGGLFAAFCIVSSLVSRALGDGGGEYIDVSMTDVVLSFSQSVAHQALTGDDPMPSQTPLTGQYPCYGVYECEDGQYITLAALETKFWEVFCSEVGREDLTAKHMTPDEETREYVRQEVAALFLEKTRDRWLSELSDETMTGPVNSVAEAVEHPQIEARNIIERSPDNPPRIGFPALTDNGPLNSNDHAPEHGEHTSEILRANGVDSARIVELKKRNIVK